MTTFQYIIDAISQALSHVIPFPQVVSQDIYVHLLKWAPVTPELQLIVCLVGSVCFLVFFRYDWLGLISAVLKSIVQPASLKSERRTLDQHTVLFLTLILVPALLAIFALRPMIRDIEILMHPFVMAAILFVVAGLLQFASGWNRRLKGLNHLRLVDAILVAALALLSAHPAFSLVPLLWIGFSVTNYHYEAVFKYSMLILGMLTFARLFTLLHEVSLKGAFDFVGHLNSIAVIAVSITSFWMALENLQQSLNETTLRLFKWFSLIFGLFYVVIYFVRG